MLQHSWDVTTAFWQIVAKMTTGLGEPLSLWLSKLKEVLSNVPGDKNHWDQVVY